ncbi:MAG: Uncharacterised protein [SAR116 cluster bacterium]|nr:MAG: Uncharacterised protein [SAR116 cluster bacterium]
MKVRKDPLCLRCHGGLCGQHRCLAEDREFFQNKLYVIIFSQQLLKRCEDAFAIATVIIAEFIDHDAGIRIADKRVSCIVMQGAQRHR